MGLTISVDLGGTSLRVGLVSAGGEVVRVEKVPSGARDPWEVTLGRIAELIEKVAAGSNKISGLALGVPGIVDRQGVVHSSPHFPDWKEVDVGAWFRKRFPWPVIVDNDAHMIARGEQWKGAGEGIENFIILTLGTGVGGAIVWKNGVVSGDSGFAGELGHMVIETEGPACNCGSQGCFEMYVSATGILHWLETGDRLDPVGRGKLLERFGGIGRITVDQIYDAAREGDITAHALFRRMGYFLGIGIASLVNVTGIETMILGGGVSQAWDFFIEPAKKELAERTYAETSARVQILKAQLGEEAGLIGGAVALLKE